MYFRFERRYNLLQVSDDYAHLRSIHSNGDLEFEVLYRIKPQDAVTHESLTVNVIVSSRTFGRRSILGTSNEGRDRRKLIDNVRSDLTNAKNVSLQRKQYRVALKSSDVSARINNENVAKLRSRSTSPLQSNPSTLKLVPVSSVKEGVEAKPVLSRIAHGFTTSIDTVHSSSIDESPARLMYDMILKHGVDPSSIAGMTHRSVTANDAVDGTLRRTRSNELEYSTQSRLLHYHLFQPEAQSRPLTTDQVRDTELVHVLVNEPDPYVDVPVTFVIPAKALNVDGHDASHFFVSFDLINGRTGVSVDTVVKPLDVARHVQLHNTPRKAPIVKVAASDIAPYVNLEIKQVDYGARGVQVFRKSIHGSTIGVDDYVLIATYDLRHGDQSLLVSVDVPVGSTTLYRVIPIGEQGAQGFEYTNVVVRPARYQPIKSLSLTAQVTELGVRLEARGIPKDVTSIEFRVRNRTVHEKDFRNVGGDVLLVDDAAREVDYITIVDSDVYTGNVYEYVARLVYVHGTNKDAGNAIVEYVQQSPGKVDTRVDNVVVTQDTDPNVTFDVSTTVIDGNIDVIKNLLQRQDVYEQFRGDVTREREFLKSLIAHNVQRVDLTTGNRDDFGVVTSERFDDAALRKNQAIDPPKLGHKYRYEVTALLRAPETMFETLVKDATDAVTKKSYTYSPAKFFHPLALTRGVLMTASGLRTRYAKDAMSHGAIGTMTPVDVSFDVEPAYVIDPAAARFDRYLNTITWKVEGSVDQIDHFIIMKDVHGVRTIIGKTHSEYVNGNCQYLHEITRRDEGALVYVIVPVFNDYKVGTSAVTNNVIVERIRR